MKGGALIVAMGKPKAGPSEKGGDTAGAHSEAKADLALALEEWQAATTPEAKADAFLAALDLAEECRGYASDEAEE